MKSGNLHNDMQQGFTVGPLLYLLFNDLTLCIRSNKLLHADVIKIYTAVKNVEDCILYPFSL